MSVKVGFKEQLKEDLDNVFFHQEEFAETHRINGKETLIIIDNDRLAELYIGRDTHTEQIFRDSIMFYVRKEDLEFEPAVDQYLEYDGSRYLVTDVKVDDGTYTIVMEANGH